MTRRRVAVIHPDLGVGGAERLIVDASKAIQDNGNSVVIYTAFHDSSRCFEETRDGSLKVVTVGQWIPRTIFGRFHALIAYIKMIYISLYLCTKSFDLLLCDQVSACIPIFKLKNYLTRQQSKIVFYCHFPDQLLTTRESILKQIYRLPIDWFEEWTTSLADVILVNSKFTKGVVKQTFKSVRKRSLIVLYPCVDVNSFLRRRPSIDECHRFSTKQSKNFHNSKFKFLSLNRYERKKELELAIKGLHSLKKTSISTGDKNFASCHLIIAGGYDERLEDCIRYYDELQQLVSTYSLNDCVTFFKSPSDREKLILLEISDALIYTPQNEHFGIVPIEAMAMRKPVIACASGGPLETVEHCVSGLLCQPEGIHEAMFRLTSNPEVSKGMGEQGFQNALRRFSYETFRERLNDICFSSAGVDDHLQD